MSIFKIEIKPGNPAMFDPNPLTARENDSAFWFNGDPQRPHWPTPNAANPKAWLDSQIPPNTTSSQISFNPGAPYTLSYVCALHPNETGQIKVTSGKEKGAFGAKTKNGAFGAKTKKGAFGSITK